MFNFNLIKLNKMIYISYNLVINKKNKGKSDELHPTRKIKPIDRAR